MVIRACRRDTFASGSSESKSTSGKIPPSASQRPIWDSSALSVNCLPTDFPRSITSLACALAEDCPEEERLTPAFALPATSGCGTAARDREPFCPSGSALKRFAPEGWSPELDRGLGRSGAPHSSQYWAPSRFSVLHLSHVIMV